LDEQRELSKLKRAKKDKPAATTAPTGKTMGQDEMDMLDMALGMLRCSVCKDRFKSVAIKKCFHLFCKECIDENLRNRSRKCPACGERFGQDDVTPIYFTN
jgi:E3 ubiquitin-protein ligase BRE1